MYKFLLFGALATMAVYSNLVKIGYRKDDDYLDLHVRIDVIVYRDLVEKLKGKINNLEERKGGKENG